MTKELQAHPELWKGLNDPSDADCAWFLKNSKRNFRIRELMPDELCALDAMAKASFGDDYLRLQLFIDGTPQPITHICVVDLLRLKKIKHGKNGESCRARFPCSAPINKTIEKKIKTAVFDWLTQTMPGFGAGRQNSFRGFK